MERFEDELAKATDPVGGHLLGAVGIVIDEKGHVLYRHVAGRQRLEDNSPPLDPDCAVSLASAAKFVTNVAALQLVEQGLLTLDEPIKKTRFTHLFFEPGESFLYGWSIYCVQLLVERLGNCDKYVQYAQEHIFAPLGMTTSTYLPAQVPHVWERRLQMVERVVGEDGDRHLVAADEMTQGITCSISDIARLFSDLLSRDCKLLHNQEHRDMLFTAQLTCGSGAHQALLAETTNYGYLLPLEPNVSHKQSWKLSPLPETVNWTVAGTLLEKDDSLSDTGLPGGTVAFEGLPNIIWTMNRERGRMMLFATQLIPSYDVEAHNVAVRFLYDAWKTFG